MREPLTAWPHSISMPLVVNQLMIQFRQETAIGKRAGPKRYFNFSARIESRRLESACCSYFIKNCSVA
jgi:hypothetical protein